MRALLLLTALALLAAGCRSTFPTTGGENSRDRLLGAAATVIKDRYPMSATLRASDHVIALGPVEMMGASKTRKQIAVWVRRNYTGHWDPIVRVGLHAQVDEPLAGARDLEGNSPTGVAPVSQPTAWQPLQWMHEEEQDLRAAILAQLSI